MRRLIAWSVVLGLGVALSGCAGAEKPAVYAYPLKGQSEAQQAKDRSECEAWAKEQSGYDPAMATAKGAGLGALIGAAAGAATGAAVGAVQGSPGKGAATGAAVGGIGGAVAGGAIAYSKDKEGFEKAYAACMSGRGYSVR